MTGTALTKKPLRQVQSVAELFDNEEAKQRLAQISARHMNPERMMRIAANAVRKTPRLKECDPISFLGGIMFFGQLGLEPDTVLGHGYLIPFKNNRRGVYEVQPIVGYKGFIDLAYRSGLITYIHADVVYSDDELWSYEHGSDAHLRHKNGPQEGEKTHAYCYVKIAQGDGREGMAMAALPWSQVIKTRNRSQGWQSAVKYGKTAESPWTTDEDAMAAKTAVRALANKGRLPMSTELRMALEADEQQTDFRAFAMDPSTGPVIEGEATEDEPEGALVEGEAQEAPQEPQNASQAGGKKSGASDTGKGGKAAGAKADAPQQAKKDAGKAAAASGKKAEAGKPKAEPPVEDAQPADRSEPDDAREKPESEASDAVTEPESEAGNAGTPHDAMVQSVVDRISDELGQCQQPGDVEAIHDLFKEQIDVLKEGYPAAYQEVSEAFDEHRERLSDG